jgi:LAGLIDADG DNA endonuclease family protein
MNIINNLNPWFITGISDGDGCFNVTILKSDKAKVGWIVTLQFTIVASNNPSNMLMMTQINLFFNNIGNITIRNQDNSILFSIQGLKNCLIVRNHFLNYPLFTYKLVYFTLWSLIIDIMLSKNHLTEEGLNEVIALKTHFKMGLSSILLSNFPNIIPVEAPNYNPDFSLLNAYWLCGFINADGHFQLLPRIRNNSNTYTLGFSISQSNISRILMEHLLNFIGFGSLYNYTNQPACKYAISSLININKLIILLKDTQFLGSKALDYRDFCLGVDLINKKEHLSKDGYKKLISLSNNMNTKRTKFI